jgi:hypothetical protein
MASKVHSKFLLPNISTSRKLQIFDGGKLAEVPCEDTMRARNVLDQHEGPFIAKGKESQIKSSGMLMDRCLTNRRGLNNRQSRAFNP